ncbi:MAG: hypothetical protein NWF07_05335 [Candidatus Bathyarchaeota archaeon]|nr:hypothetical protein [Candidatus Bathyarchaeota archaeon]
MKRILTTVLLVTLTIIANFQAPLIQAAGTGGMPMPELYDWAELGQGLAHRVNRTDLVPSNFRNNYTGGTPQLLQFRNMVMEVNCTRNMTMNITSEDDVNMPYLAMNIKTERNMHMTINAKASPPENIPGPAQGINQYMQIETNSTGPMNATLRYYMNQTQLELELGSGFNMSRMTWCYWNETDWEPVQSRLTADGFLEVNTTHFSVWTIVEQGQPEETGSGEPQGEPQRVKTMNYTYTDMVPQGFTHQVESKQATMFQFQNTGLYMNCTNSLQLEVSAENQYNQKALRLEVDSGEALKLQVQLRESKPTDVDEPGKYMGFYCEIEPNATITQARLGMEIDPAQVQAMNMEMEQLTWAYWNGENWEPVDSTLTDEDVLEADTDHFSTWAIIQVEETTEPETSTGIPMPTAFIAIGIAVALMLRKDSLGISS